MTINSQSLKEFIGIPDTWDSSKTDKSKIESIPLYCILHLILGVLSVFCVFLFCLALFVSFYFTKIQLYQSGLMVLGSLIAFLSALSLCSKLGVYIKKLEFDQKMMTKSKNDEVIKNWCSKHSEVNDYALSVVKSGRKYLSEYEFQTINDYLGEKYPKNNLDFLSQ